jgi:chromosome segregation ATPase
MAQIPLADVVRDVGEAIEQEFDALKAIARRSAAFRATREAEMLRLTLELGNRDAWAAATAPAGGESPLDLRAERDDAVLKLAEATGENKALAGRAVEAERARVAAEAALRRARAHARDLEKAASVVDGGGASLQAVQASLDALRAELQLEHLARAAADASLALLEREHDALRGDLADSRRRSDATELALSETRQLNDDLQAELGELWRILRETRPGDTMSLNITVPEGERREGVERVQAKIIDARERFKRRNHRWPLAI